jgi:hypothetical protein
MRMARTRFVSVSTELPLPADKAFALACEIETMEYVMRPLIVFAVSDEQRELAAGELPVGHEFVARLKLFGVLPLWKHRLTIVSKTDNELYTNESSGPARIWNHRLTFVPLDKRNCRYTDEIEIERGVLGVGTAAFIRVFFRHRHRRWQKFIRQL